MRKWLFLLLAILLVMIFFSCNPIINPLEIPDQIANEGEEFKLDLTKYTKAIDIDKVTYSLKSGLGRIDGKYYIWDDPDYEDSGQEVVISAKNERNVEKEGSFIITVNRIPEIEYLSPEIGSYLNDKVILTWEATDADVEDNLESQLKFDIYLGPSPDSLSKEYSDRTDATLDLTDDLTEDATHFWQVVAKDRNSTVEGDVWWFYVGNLPPNNPHSPNPSDGDDKVSINKTLSWQCTDPNEDELKFDIYFGASSNPPLVEEEVEDKEYNPATLDYLTEYYWKIVAKDPEGEVATGTVWTFETMPKLEYNLAVTTTPDTSLTITIDGNIYSSPESITVKRDDKVEIGVGTPQFDNKTKGVEGADTKYTFLQWNDANKKATRTTDPITSDITYTAEMKKEFKVETDSEPEDAPTIDGADWYEANATQTFTAPEVTGYTFDHWEVNGSKESTESTIEVTIDSPKKIVAHYNHIPTINIPDQGVDEGKTLEIDLDEYSSDPDGDPLTYSFESGVGTITDATYTYSPGYDESGTYEVTVGVNDGRGGESQDSFQVVVNNVNRAPEEPHLPSPQNNATDVTVDNLTFSWKCSDPDGDELTYDVYFGMNSNPTEKVSSSQSGTTITRTSLNGHTTYYWKIVAKDGHGGDTTGPIWSFNTKNKEPNIPYNPKPNDNTIKQPTNITLSWDCIDPDGDNLTYDVYFGMNSNPTEKVSSSQSGTTITRTSLNGHTTYYWKIVAKDGHGGETTGPIWKFTTKNRNPAAPTNPHPPENSSNQPIEKLSLSWECSDPDGDSLTYDIYFGTNNNPTKIVSSNQTETKLIINNLNKYTTYYWRVVAKDNNGGETKGPIWFFNTTPLKWTYQLDDMVTSSPAIGKDGTIYVVSCYHVYAINPNGKLKWKYKSNYYMYTPSPTIGNDGTIYIGNNGCFYSISPEGELKWKFDDGRYFTSPAIGIDEIIYLGSHNYLYSITKDGKLKWKYSIGYNIYSVTLGNDGTIYAGSGDTLYAIASDGTLKWKYETQNVVYSNPAIGEDGTIYIGSNDKHIYAIGSDGTLKWKFNTGDCVRSSPAIGEDGTIYVGSGDSLYSITKYGTLKWKYDTSKIVDSSPAIGENGIIYIGSYDNNIYAVNPDGSLKWKFGTGKYVYSSPTIISDGTIYVGSADNAVFAIQSSSLGLADSPWPKFRKDIKNTGSF